MVRETHNRELRYLTTLEELYSAALANLGPMDTKSLEEFQKEASMVANQAGISRFRLALDLSFKEPDSLGITEQPQTVTDFEWNQHIEAVGRRTTRMPNVFVVDGTKYALLF